MPSRLKNAIGAFQRAMDVVQQSVTWQFALIYLDDIVVISKSLSEHIEFFRHDLTLLLDRNVTLKLKRCKFFFNTIDY